MKLICSKSELIKKIGIVIKAVPSKTTMPILECILIKAQAGEISFTANDMELGIETKVEGVILEDGKAALEAKLFSDIVRKLPDADVEIEADSAGRAVITCERSVFRIAGRDPDEFSAIPVVEKEFPVTVSQLTLRDVIQQTIFSIAPNDTNKMMTGELFEIENDRWKVVSLDGHRISIRQVQLREPADPVKVIVPGKTLSEIAKILDGDSQDDVMMYFTKNHVMFEFGKTIVVSRLIEGNYFRIDQMLTTDHMTKVTISKRELLDCIDRATLLVKESDKKPIIMNIKDESIEMKIDSQIGSMDEELAVEEKEGRDLMIGFNPRYLIDALRVIDDETVGLYFVNSKAPCFIRDEKLSYIYLILPVNFV